jgi:GT2 family glycosyltransferase
MIRVTIALTRYNEPNWLLWEALDGIAAQQSVGGEVLVLDQTEDPETAERIASLGSARLLFRWMPIPARSLSYARNHAIAIARFPVVLFLDADAVAEPRWAAELAATLSQPGVAVAGGRILPEWHRRPLLISRARVVLEQYSVLDHGPMEAVVPKIVGAGFGIHRERLGDQAYFDEDLGRRAGSLLGGEETDLCVRATRAGHEVRYNGRAIVHHHILPERIRYRWILKRIYFAGVSRALQGGVPAPTHGVGLWDLAVLPMILPVYALGFLKGRAGGIPHRQPPPA